MQNKPNQTRTISSEHMPANEYLQRVISQSGLMISFARSTLQGRTAQTWMGYFLNLIQIIISTLLYWLIFGYILQIESGNIPFPLFILTGLIPWVYFSGLIRDAGTSMTNNSHIITKIYFPRVILPMSNALYGLLDFGIAISLAIILSIIYGLFPGWQLLCFPIFLIIIMFSGIAVGLWIASLSVRYRDLSRIIPYLINFAFFLTPVFYPATLVPDKIKFILYFNPAALAIEGFRWSLFGCTIPDTKYLFSIIPMCILFIIGWRTIRKNEKNYADII